MKLQIRCKKCGSDKVFIDSCMVDSAQKQKVLYVAGKIVISEGKQVEKSAIRIKCQCEACCCVNDLLSVNENQGLWVMVD
jgi:hypothetical protein